MVTANPSGQRGEAAAGASRRTEASFNRIALSVQCLTEGFAEQFDGSETRLALSTVPQPPATSPRSFRGEQLAADHCGQIVKRCSVVAAVAE